MVFNKFPIAIVAVACKDCQAGNEHGGRGYSFIQLNHQKGYLAWVLDSLVRSDVSGKVAY